MTPTPDNTAEAMLLQVKNEVAKEYGLEWDHENKPDTRIDRVSMWPTVCERYASLRERAKDEEIDILKSVIEDRFSVQSNLQGYMSGLLTEIAKLKERIEELEKIIQESGI